MFDEKIISEIQTKNNIIDIISEYIKIKKIGNLYFGLCPFHKESSPSFSVSEEKQMYYCFGCGKGGNMFSFIMEYKKCTFADAVKILAKRTGIVIPKEEDKDKELKEKIYAVNKEAAKYFYTQLKRSKAGQKYFKERKLDNTIINHFGLGYSNPYCNDLYKYLKGKGFDEEILKESCLFTYTVSGTYDKFWDRVMFPIIDTEGRIAGFGGRILGDGKPKYINSPETKVFKKSELLYGMNFAKNTDKDYFLICEGYMDVIALHKTGFTNAVAALGTAFTESHANLLKKYTDTVILTFDSDEAGKKAAMRSIPILKEAGLKIKILNMDPYKDPDEIINYLGKEEYQKRIDEAEDSIFFEAETLKKEYEKNMVNKKNELYDKIACKILEEHKENFATKIFDTQADLILAKNKIIGG